MDKRVAIVVPCFNEQGGIKETVHRLMEVAEQIEHCKVIIVNDGSTDDTASILEKFRGQSGIEILCNSVNRGYGAALKKAIRNSNSDLIAIIDADLTYPEALLPELIKRCERNDMVVGVRPNNGTEHNSIRLIPKYLFRKYVQWIVKEPVPDFNSGLRVFRRELALKYLPLLPDGFSFTTTITIALHLERYRVEYVPITYTKRVGDSKIRPVRDTIKFLGLMIRTGIYFSPLRILTPVMLLTFGVAVCTLAYDSIYAGDIGEKTVLLFLLAFNILLLGVLADMVAKKR